MRLRDRPLLVDGVDRHLYVERPVLEEAVERPLLAGRNVLLLGEPGAGKSTLMRRIAARLRNLERPVAWVNAAPADDAASFLDLVNDALGDDAQRETATAREPLSTAGSLLVAARRLGRSRPATVVVDGLLDAQIGFDVFGRLRDELWQAGHAWLVAVRPRDSGALRTPPADAFWGTIVEIPPLDLDEATALLRRGLDDDEYARVDRDRPIAGIFPRALIREAEGRLSVNTDACAVAGGELERRASRLGRSEGLAMIELVGLGRPVSAHDPELLERLEWSRPYAQRILSHLETAGLVRSIPERGGERAGRPRKLYEPNPAAT